MRVLNFSLNDAFMLGSVRLALAIPSITGKATLPFCFLEGRMSHTMHGPGMVGVTKCHTESSINLTYKMLCTVVRTAPRGVWLHLYTEQLDSGHMEQNATLCEVYTLQRVYI